MCVKYKNHKLGTEIEKTLFQKGHTRGEEEQRKRGGEVKANAGGSNQYAFF